MKGCHIEYASEYIKTWAYQDRCPESYDQLYVFAKQLKAEDLFLSSGVHVVTDSPLPMQVAYAERSKFEGANALRELCNLFETKYPSINIFLDRKCIEYQQHGRWENITQAVEMDNRILAILDSFGLKYRIFRPIDVKEILNFANDALQTP